MVACDTLLSEVRGGLAGSYFRDRITDEERTVIPAMLAALAVIAPDPVYPPPILQGRHAGVSVCSRAEASPRPMSAAPTRLGGLPPVGKLAFA